MDIKKIFGQNLTNFRKNNNFTQEQLAESLKISVKHLSAIESGRKFVSIPLMERICVFFKITPEKLFETQFNLDAISVNDITKIEKILIKHTQRFQKDFVTELYKKFK